MVDDGKFRSKNFKEKLGDWGLGGIGQSPIPNPQKYFLKTTL